MIRRRGTRILTALTAVVVAVSAVHPAATAGAPPVQITVLSNRADVISGGDALVEIVLPADTPPSDVRVSLADRDITGAFALRPNGKFQGLVTDLALGENTLTARLPRRRGASITITNHPIGGPVFAGPQVQPWICATEEHGLGPAQDEQCNTATVFDFFYRSTNPAAVGFQPYDPDNPPDDVAHTTTDQGETVPYIVRRERGVIDRGIYDIAVLFNPDRPWAPWAPQPGWNGKVVWPFGFDCQTWHRQEDPDSGGPPPLPLTLDDASLSRGFAVAHSNLNNLGQNCNDVVSAEAMTMLKEHLVERYGEVRYTIGYGVSGGSIQQHLIASNYPGLVDGLLPYGSFPDVMQPLQEAEDCHLLNRVFDQASPALWAATAQRAAVAGYATEATCRVWNNPVQGGYARSFLDPANAAGCDLSEEQVYDPRSNPNGVRCTLQDYGVSVWGRRDSDGFANRPYDNVGVQYGLTALESGVISPEQFVDLNEQVGGLDIDWNWQPERSQADPAALEVAYRGGRSTYPREAAQVPIIDVRGSSNFDVHTDVHSYTMRERLIQANGHADNHVIWTSPVALLGDPDGNLAAFLLMDRWLAAIEADTSLDPLEVKVVRNKPGDAVDTCWIAGRRITDRSACRAAFPYFATPRIAGGGPLTDDVLKCQLKPLERTDYSVSFTDDQWLRLRQAFPTGACDYRKPAVGRQAAQPWLSFADGPGGRPLGDPPVSTQLRPSGQPQGKS